MPAAVLALLAASFSAGTAFLHADARQWANLRRKHAWQEVEGHARLVLAREAYMTADDLYSALSRLLKLRSAVPSSAIILSTSQDIGGELGIEVLANSADPFVAEYRRHTHTVSLPTDSRDPRRAV